MKTLPKPPFWLFPDQDEVLLFDEPDKLESGWGDPTKALERLEKFSGSIVAGGSGYPDLAGQSWYFWGAFSQAKTVPWATVAAWAGEAPVFCSPLEVHLTPELYEQKFESVKEALRRGDSYQVNLTFPYSGGLFRPGATFDSRGALRAWLDLVQAGQGQQGCFADLGDRWILSLSPELFWERSGNLVTCRPMKGTGRRHANLDEDLHEYQSLAQSSKVRSENLMIVDLVRNDLGIVAEVGSVKVPKLFEVEAYPTVLQMTSTVTAQFAGPSSVLWKALFPCGSITGAPKIKTRQLIEQIEDGPRGWYCGSAGWVMPDRERFNVLIRTLDVKKNGQWTAGTGGGITWDSCAESEWAEALVKTQFLKSLQRPFGFLETLLWTPENRWYLLDRHLMRLEASVRAFHEEWNPSIVRQSLEKLDAEFEKSKGRWRVRLVLGPEGGLQTTVQSLATSDPTKPLTVALAKTGFGPESLVYRVFKTTNREIYDFAAVAGFDQTLYYNERNELTETTTMNLILRFGSRLLTPALTSGLLAGTLRAELLDQGEITEAILPVSAVFAADEIFLINSVRGRQPAILQNPATS